MPIWNEQGYISVNSRPTVVRSGSDPDRGRLFPLGRTTPGSPRQSQRAPRPNPEPEPESRPERRPAPERRRESDPDQGPERRPDPRSERPPEPKPEPKPDSKPERRRATGSEAAITRLLHAIALEEAAMAHLIQTEMEKAERASRQTAGAYSLDEVLALHRSAADIIYVIARKEELLVAKLQAVMAIAESLVGERRRDSDEEH